MAPPHRDRRAARARRWWASLRWRVGVLWIAALVLPTQGMAGCVYSLLGPLHMHRLVATQTATLKLVDLRRAAFGAGAADAVARMTVAGRSDAHASPAQHHAPQRHHHAFGDRSVEPIDGDTAGVDGGSDDGAGSAAALAALAAIVGDHAPAWGARRAEAGAVSVALWVPSMADVRLPERPPRCGSSAG